MKKYFFAAFSLFLLCSSAYALNEKLFYLTNDDKNFIQQFDLHHRSIDILGPQVYELDKNGNIGGHLDPAMLEAANRHHVKVMPLVINTHFDQNLLHAFLQSLSAQRRSIATMLALCDKYHLYGLQFDIENISTNDKNEFTHYFITAADTLHQHGYAVSIAVVPRNDSLPIETPYESWIYDNWTGAYDYEILAKHSDFISLMTYDRHTTLTTPGPVAPYEWVEKTLQELLRKIPATKLSLGIPVYSGYWTTGIIPIGDKIQGLSKFSFRSREKQIGYDKLSELMNQFRKPLIWDNEAKSSYLMHSNKGLYEYIFAENARSFKARIELAKKYHLRGVSVWKMGLEDPKIWDGLS